MRYTKRVVGKLEKCYALSDVFVDGTQSLLVAAEKRNPCFRYDLDGNLLDTVWSEPGGVMTMVPVPGHDGVFLATHEFYSPNDSASARIVCATRGENGWTVTTVATLPFVHRFDILPRGGVNHVLACTLKSGHQYKDDWRFPGKLWAGVLPEDPSSPMQLTVLREGLGHNHGYTRYSENGVLSGIVSCDQGVFRVTPPEVVGKAWTFETLLKEPTSDAVMMDMDGDTLPEILTISPFHGDTLSIFHLDDGGIYQRVYEFPDKLPFLHAICGGTVYDRPTVYVGNREGNRLLLGFFWNPDRREYEFEEVDRGSGAANCLLFDRNGRPALLAANRETDEIAIYDIGNGS